VDSLNETTPDADNIRGLFDDFGAFGAATTADFTDVPDADAVGEGSTGAAED
jgi:hypothetical protein